ncbi:MAG: hypothetical protein QXX36_03305 [Candidatus Rehaiarchaeum fermentans]|nr:hypothetical protein [Candidatus Rehaiarchaeum fermentans]
MENLTQIPKTPTQKGEQDEKEELLKIAKRLGPVQIQVIQALERAGGKLPFHEHEGEDDAIDNYTRTTLSVYYTTLKAYRVVRSLEKRGLAELRREDCTYHKGRVKMYVYLTEKGKKLAGILSENE